MAWAFDAANAGVTEADVDGVVTFNQTTGAITNGMIFVWAAWSTTTTTILSVTYNGRPMNWAVNSTPNRSTALYYLENPDPGVNPIVITFSAAAGRVCAGSASYSGLAQVQTPSNNTNTGTDSIQLVDITANQDDLLLAVLGTAFVAGDTLSGDATERGNISGGATRGNFQELNATGGLDVITWTNSNTRAYGASIANFAPFVAPVVSGGGGATPVRNWDGRGYERGNIEVIRRGRRTVLHPVKESLTLSITATLETYKPTGTKPSIDIPAQEPAKSIPRTYTLQSYIPALILSISQPQLDSLPPSVTQISRLESKQDARISKLESRLADLEKLVRTVGLTNKELTDRLSSANSYIDELEEQLILGTR